MKQYIREKIKLLKQFKIFLNDEQLKHIRSLKTEVAVDNFARDLLSPGYEESHGNMRGKRGFCDC